MQLEQRLMGANPREPAAKAGTHVETVECRRELERRYACHVEFRDGTLGNFQVVVSRDGRTLRFT